MQPGLQQCQHCWLQNGGSCALPGHVTVLFVPLTCSSALRYHDIRTYICMSMLFHSLSASHNLPIPNPSAAGGEPLYSGTLCITKQKGKSYIVPEIHGLFKHSQVHLLKYCPNSHLSTYKAYRLTVNQSRRCARGRQAAHQLATSAAEPGRGSRSQKAGANYFTKYTQPRQ